jgi:IS30 family transposase
MKKYKQLSLAQRYQIEFLSKAGLPQTPIAFLLGVDKSTICRELKRNMPGRGLTTGQYIGEHAQQKTDLHHSTKSKRILLSAELKKRIAELMWHQKWSPELIAKQLAKEGEQCVSQETIYQLIWMAKHSNYRDHANNALR